MRQRLHFCSFWYEGQRCRELADVTFHAPDGDMVPGGWMCRPHAEEVQNEYAEKLHEYWEVREIPEEVPS